MRQPLLTSSLLLAGFTLSALASEGVIKRGEAISTETRKAQLAEVLAEPEAFTKSPVIVEGVVSNACTRKGCWMQLASGEASVRVTFKDYGFFIPTDSKGYQAVAEGVAKVRTVPKKEVDHLEEEGAKFVRNKDGSAREVSFVASGIELRKEQ